MIDCIEKIRQNYRCWDESKGKRKRMSEHETKKAERAKRVKLYAEQIKDTCRIKYLDPDEDSKYKFEMAFAKYCPTIDLEDCDE